jgi:hypothetical protein
MDRIATRPHRQIRAAERKALAMVWAAVMLLALLGMAALVCDVGYRTVVGQQLQSAADAAALAAAFCLGPSYDPDKVRSVALAAALSNTAAKLPVEIGDNAANADGGDVVIGQFDESNGGGTFTATLNSPNAVKVVTRRSGNAKAGPLPLFFAPVLGVATTNVERTAIAKLEPGVKPGLIVLDPHGAGALSMGGNPTIDVIGGDVVVDSDSADAVSVGSNSKVIADTVRLMPAPYANGSGFVGGSNVSRMTKPMADPLADTAEPTWSGLTSETMPGSGTYTPVLPGDIHYYKNGLSVGSNSTLTIARPGIYVLGKDLSLQAGGTLIAHGVMFHLVNGATVRMKGHPTLDISPPTTGPYEGISIWQARNNSSPADFGGTSTLKVLGILYFPSAVLSVGGTSDNFSNQLIAKDIKLQGNGTITIHWNGRPGPPWACLMR